ncbi:MAG: AMP-binding protein [Alphaproteobacteria bacterium]|nr:AMP-binding protein [Alphaproteobacteria bacterium]MBL7099190.1 AMP-binding protein [Alphaproteobacteria bacterium]
MLTQSYFSATSDKPLVYETIGACFDRTADHFGDRDGLIVRHQNTRWTYAEYRREVDRFAAGLISLGIGKGDRVGVWAPNCYEWCLTQFATAKLGAILVCINPAYRIYELEFALNKSGCVALVTAQKYLTSDYAGMVAELRDAGKLPYLQRVIAMGETPPPGMLKFAEISARGDGHTAQLAGIAKTLSPDDAINIQFTSGTTGQPKGATLSHFNILNNGRIVAEGMRFTERDRLCIPVPLYHCFGMVMSNLACISHGAAAVFPNDGFDAVKTLEAVQAERCTALHGVPTMFIAELEHPRFHEFDLASLRTGIMAGAPCPVEVMKRVQNDMHMKEVLIAYGQTETSPVNHQTTKDDPLDKQVETVGRPGPHLEIKLVDELGAVVPIGQPGEICCRGYSVMQGYWDEPGKTADTVDSAGWLHSGDLGVMDADGYTRIVGRLKDMIIRGGENVYPREVEEFLFTHVAVAEVQVFGVPDRKYGEQVCAWIKLRPGHSPTEEDIRTFCKDKIAHFKVPRYVRFVEIIPMTVTGKPQKFKMREAMVAELRPDG